MTRWHGFLFGFGAAVLFEAAVFFNILSIPSLAHLVIVVVAIVFSVVITVYSLHEGSSMIGPTVDGFVIGFTLFYTVLELLQGRISFSYMQS
jgi:hypothetical protein